MLSSSLQPTRQQDTTLSGSAEKGTDSSVEHTNTVAAAVSQRKVTELSWAIAILALLSSTFLYVLDNTIMANVRPSILSIFIPHGGVGSNPLWGKLNKHFNNKTAYLTALLVFEIGSAVIGSASSAEVVVVGRALAGFGGCGIYVGTMNIVSAITTPMERTHYLNMVGFLDGLSILTSALLPSLHRHCSSGGVVSIVMILGSGGALYAWNDSHMIALYAVAAILWILFSIQQRFSLLTVDRIFPVQFVGNWEMVLLFSWTAVAISNLVVTVYSLPLLFQFTFGDSSLVSGLYTIPFVAAVIVSIGSSGPLFSKYPFYAAWFAGASMMMLIGSCLLSTLDYTTSYGRICGHAVIGGFGVGPVVQLGYTVAQVKVTPKSVSEATAFLSCAQMAGFALSLGISTSVFLNEATNDIAALLPDWPRDRIMAAIDSADVALFNNVDEQTRTRIGMVIARKVGDVFYTNVAGATFGFIGSLLISGRV
ncbi:MFS general substrate transporter [Hypoxylon crocopeplum]|nr:MFS general substrate transporter [Hypoxylon crocopeplum]